MPGFPLEDVELGRGTHWEARLAGPEFMSYGAHVRCVLFDYWNPPSAPCLPRQERILV